MNAGMLGAGASSSPSQASQSILVRSLLLHYTLFTGAIPSYKLPQPQQLQHARSKVTSSPGKQQPSGAWGRSTSPASIALQQLRQQQQQTGRNLPSMLGGTSSYASNTTAKQQGSVLGVPPGSLSSSSSSSRTALEGPQHLTTIVVSLGFLQGGH
jgi:hypothetical protein